MGKNSVIGLFLSLLLISASCLALRIQSTQARGVPDEFSQSASVIVQTRLGLLMAYSVFFLNLAMEANLTDVNGNAVAGETIVFYFQQYSVHTATNGWYKLGSSTSNEAGLASLSIAFSDPFGGLLTFKAVHEQSLNFSASVSGLLSITLPGGYAVRILNDGSIYPSNAPIEKKGDVYTLTGDITTGTDGISIERDNITLDGSGHWIEPPLYIIGEHGINVAGRTNVTIENVCVESFAMDINLINSENNMITMNNLTGQAYPISLLGDLGTFGLWLGSSANNIVSANEISNTDTAVVLLGSSHNEFYLNSFINSTSGQVYTDSQNIWDNGYPYGGNYWSDYHGSDMYSGPFQNLTGSDGIGDTPYVIDSNNLDNYPLMPPPVINDVAITNINFSKTVVGQGFELSMNIEAANLRTNTETFNVTVYANSTYVDSQNVTLHGGCSADMGFIWNTTGFEYGNYTISAYAWPVPKETNIENNNFTGGTVVVTIPGDVNGDGKVNLADLVALALAYRSTPGSSNWNPNADIDNNGVVNLIDLVTSAIHYGQHYP